VLSGFTIVRNAVRLDYPIVPAIRSILDLCDEVVVNVGASDDGTRDLVASLGDSRIRILDTVWDFSRGGHTLSYETNRAMAACRGTWGVYIQADEVLHETGAALLREQLPAATRDPGVEGLLVEYRHFYGDFDTLATNRHWYRREVRVVRLDRDIRSYQDAQGFRVGDGLRRVRARATGALMFHYGWARAQLSVGKKLAASKQIFPHAKERLEQRERIGQLEWTPLLRRFTGTHPRAAAHWIDARRAAAGGVPPLKARRVKVSDVRFYLSDWIERLTGTRIFEYRNYVVV
jgi:glycosyltransferase involved in cell wall biosynthesis